jgi:glycosyltransferase involved in cell wall biosynthesis
MKPKVLFLDHTGSLGGAEQCLLDIARHYAANGKVVLLADGPFRERLQTSGVPVGVLPSPAAVSEVRREGGKVDDLRAMPMVIGLARRLSREARGYDVLYANSQKALVIGALAGFISRKPVIWHLHDILTAEHFSTSHRRLSVTLANRLTDRVIANSEASAQAFVDSGGRRGLARVIYNGVDPGPFDSVVEAWVATLRRELGLPEAAPIVGAFSRLAPWKGQHVLLEALPHLSGVHALLVGDALFGEADYARSLRKQARALGIENRVHFLGFREDVPTLMALSDIVVHTSTSPEPFGRMIVEGMLARTPVVASKEGGCREIVQEGVSGVLVPPGDAVSLAGALRDLLENPERSRGLALAGRTAALESFSLPEVLRKIDMEISAVTTIKKAAYKTKERFAARS